MKHLLLVSLLVLTACTSARIGTIKTNYDEFKQVTYESVQITGRTALYAVTPDDGPTSYAFIITNSVMGDYAAINQVIFIADGDRIELGGDSKLQDVSASSLGVMYSETSVFPVSEAQLRVLAEASEVNVRVYGANRDGKAQTLSKKSMAALDTFLGEFVDTTATSSQ